MESPASGGSLATAHYADGYNRTVMAPPGRTTDANSFGTNALIRNRKATLIRSAEDIVEELQWEFALDRDEIAPAVPTPSLTAEEEAVLALLGDEPRPLAELIGRKRTGLCRAERPAHGARALGCDPPAPGQPLST